MTEKFFLVFVFYHIFLCKDAPWLLPPMMFFQTYLFIKLLIYYLRDNCIFSFLEHSRANFNNSKSAFWELFPVNFILLDLTRGMAVFIQIRYLLNCRVYIPNNICTMHFFLGILNNFINTLF